MVKGIMERLEQSIKYEEYKPVKLVNQVTECVGAIGLSQ